jgi:protein TonB
VKVVEVRFEDGTIWEVDSPDVDETPAPLTRAQPKHTEEALRNRIQGAVRLRLLVSADGEVRNVKIIQGLPDGLDAEAVQEAYSLKFKPPIKAGLPTEYWLLFEIEYNLPSRGNDHSKSGNPRL